MADDDWQPDEAPPEPEHERRGDRLPPANPEAERAVLGSMLISKDAIEDVVSTLYGRDFYNPHHETIYDAIVDLYGLGLPVDMLTVHGALQASGEARKVGGAPYLHTLANGVPIAANAAHYAEQVREAAVFRRMVDAGTRIAQRGYAQEGTAAAAADAAAADLDAIAGTQHGTDYVLAAEALTLRLDDLDDVGNSGEVQGIPTGFYDLDDLTTGLHPGQMVVVAGRPAMGKSTLALDMVRAAAIRHRVPTCIFSLEMDRNELIDRALAAEARVPLANIRAKRLTDDDWQRVAMYATGILDAPLWIDDSANMTPTEIRAKARRLKAQHNLGLIVIDYMQLMSSGRRVENRQVEVSEFSRQIKLLAKEMQVPVIVLSQLNRGVEGRSSKRPLLSDLRESGAIEQDADLVILLHREDAYEVESSRPGEADLIVAKNRNGATRDVVVAAQLHYSRFVDMATG